MNVKLISAWLLAITFCVAAWAARGGMQAEVGVQQTVVGAPELSAEDTQARVVGVQDGDTITVYARGAPQTRIRLVEIDAPESSQPYGQKSKQVLSDMVFGKTVRVRSEGEDRYGRMLSRIYVGDTDVNAEMVRQGAAWVYTDYNKDPAFPPLQARARRERLGLWASQADQITPPWEWRRGARTPTAANDNAPLRERVAPRPQARESRPGASASGQCAGKTRCAQMADCAEARFYLTQCGVGTLDGDKDGVPCEAICG